MKITKSRKASQGVSAILKQLTANKTKSIKKTNLVQNLPKNNNVAAKNKKDVVVVPHKGKKIRQKKIPDHNTNKVITASPLKKKKETANSQLKKLGNVVKKAKKDNNLMEILGQLFASLKKATSHQKKLPPVPAVQNQKQTKQSTKQANTATPVLKQKKSQRNVKKATKPSVIPVVATPTPSKSVQAKASQSKASVVTSRNTSVVIAPLQPRKSRRDHKLSYKLLAGDRISKKRTTSTASKETKTPKNTGKVAQPVASSPRAIRQRAPFTVSPILKKAISKQVKKVVTPVKEKETKQTKIAVAQKKKIAQNNKKIAVDKVVKHKKVPRVKAAPIPAVVVAPVQVAKASAAPALNKKRQTKRSNSTSRQVRELTPPKSTQSHKQQRSSSSSALSSKSQRKVSPVVAVTSVSAILPKVSTSSLLKKAIAKAPSKLNISKKTSVKVVPAKPAKSAPKVVAPAVIVPAVVVHTSKKASTKPASAIQPVQVKIQAQTPAPKQQVAAILTSNKVKTPEAVPKKTNNIVNKHSISKSSSSSSSSSTPNSIWSSFKSSSHKEETGKSGGQGSRIVDLKPFDRILSQLGLHKRIYKPKQSPVKSSSKNHKKINKKIQKSKKQASNKKAAK